MTFPLAQILASPFLLGCGLAVALMLLLVVSWYLREAGIFHEASEWLHDDERLSDQLPPSISQMIAQQNDPEYYRRAIAGGGLGQTPPMTPEQIVRLAEQMQNRYGSRQPAAKGFDRKLRVVSGSAKTTRPPSSAA